MIKFFRGSNLSLSPLSVPNAMNFTSVISLGVTRGIDLIDFTQTLLSVKLVRLSALKISLRFSPVWALIVCVNTLSKYVNFLASRPISMLCFQHRLNHALTLTISRLISVNCQSKLCHASESRISPFCRLESALVSYP